MNSKRYLHDRFVLSMVTAMSILVVVGLSSVLLRFDSGKNPTTVAEYRQSLSSSGYIAGTPIDIYLMGIFIILVAVMALVLSRKIYSIRRFVSYFLLAGTNFLLILTIIVSNALINLQ